MNPQVTVKKCGSPFPAAAAAAATAVSLSLFAGTARLDRLGKSDIKAWKGRKMLERCLVREGFSSASIYRNVCFP